MPSRNRRFTSEPYRLLSSIAAVLVGLSHSASAKSTRCPAPPVLTLGDCRIPQPGGPDIQSYGILIGVTDKTRATTHVCTMPSTLIPNMAFTEANLCSAADQRGAMSTAQCLSRRGGVLDVRNFDTVPLDRLLPRPGWTAFNPDFQFAIEAPLSLQSTRLTLPEALITGGPNLTTSYIGLSDESELLKALQDSGFIDSRSWMLDAGSRSASNPRSGTLILGGFDSSIVQGDFTTFPINYNKTAGSRYCPLQIIVESMNWRTGSDVRNLVDASTKATVCIDPYDTLFRLSRNMLQAVQVSYAAAVGSQAAGSGPLSSADPDILILEPGLAYPAPPNIPEVALDINIQGGLSVSLPSYELIRPLRGLASNGSIVTNSSFVEIQVFENTSPADALVFGKVFLSQFVLVVDYTRGEFKLARRATGQTSPPNIQSIGDGNCSIGNGGLGATVVGLIVGLVVASVIAAILAIIVWKWRPRVLDPQPWLEE